MKINDNVSISLANINQVEVPDIDAMDRQYSNYRLRVIYRGSEKYSYVYFESYEEMLEAKNKIDKYLKMKENPVWIYPE